MKKKSLCNDLRFPAVVISCAVRWHFRFRLSLRAIEERLFEPGVLASYELIRRWCAKLSAGFAHRAQAALIILLQKRRDRAAAKRCLQRVQRTCPARA